MDEPEEALSKLLGLPSEALDTRAKKVAQLVAASKPVVPMIRMSQNRQSDKDRLHAEHSYEVNLKSELEIMLLHEKLDLVYEKQRVELLESQKDQLKLLVEVLQKKTLSP